MAERSPVLLERRARAPAGTAHQRVGRNRSRRCSVQRKSSRDHTMRGTREPFTIERCRCSSMEAGMLARHSFRTGTRCSATLAAILVAPCLALAQAYPAKPIRIIVPYAAGGAVDIVARTTGQALGEALKQAVIVDNRPGASANIGMEAVAKAGPDGYTLLMASNGIATNMALFPNLPFDGRRDFEPVARIGYAPLVIVVPAASPAKSLKDLLAMAKA